MTPEDFQKLIKPVADAIAGKEIEPGLGVWLNERFPADGAAFKAIEAACREAIAEGWMCNREHEGIRYSRPVKPTADLNGFSVDVVVMKDLAGSRHAHPKGEVVMVMPDADTPDAHFCGAGRGWAAYPPGSAHAPTVGQGGAVVLYMLPDGLIDFKPN